MSLQRKTELKSDPVKERASRQRAAERYQKRRAENARALLAAGVPLETLARVSKQRMQSEGEKIRRRGSTMKDDGKGFAASAAQRRKVRREGSIVSGEHGCDPAHLWPRGRGGCDSPMCVVPLTRAEHEAFDRGDLDLLPHLLNHGCWRELAHMVARHRVDPLSMLHRLTGERHEPAGRSA